MRCHAVLSNLSSGRAWYLTSNTAVSKAERIRDRDLTSAWLSGVGWQSAQHIMANLKLSRDDDEDSFLGMVLPTLINITSQKGQARYTACDFKHSNGGAASRYGRQERIGWRHLRRAVLSRRQFHGAKLLLKDIFSSLRLTWSKEKTLDLAGDATIKYSALRTNQMHACPERFTSRLEDGKSVLGSCPGPE